MAEIVLDHVDKVYPGGVKGVDGLSLEIRDGEFMVLVGPSGCGKSTALRSIAGLEEISAGTISIGGRVVNDLPPKDRDIAMVFQNYALYPHMTVEQNLAFGLQAAQDAEGRGPAAGHRGGRDPGPEELLAASRAPCRAASGSGWRWGGPSSASRRRS